MPKLSPCSWRRLAGGALLAALAFAGLFAGVAFYADATREHVEVAFSQEGLAGGGLLQIYVDCSGPYGSGDRPESGVVDLGWLEPGELVTVQARFGGTRAALRYRVIVDGRQRVAYRSRGAPGRLLTGPPGRWLEHRTYTASGQEVVHAGCDTSGAKPALALADPGPRSAPWSEWVFTTATVLAPAMLWLYYVAGLCIVVIVVIAQAIARALETRRTSPIVVALAGVILGVATVAHELALDWLKGVIAGLTALVSAIIAAWWLRRDIARAGDALRRVASMLFPKDSSA
jgi:hypothetical protein